MTNHTQICQWTNGQNGVIAYLNSIPHIRWPNRLTWTVYTLGPKPLLRDPLVCASIANRVIWLKHLHHVL